MSRRVWGTTLLAYLVSQALLAAGSIFKIPLLVSGLGPKGYGVIILVSSAWTVINAFADGLTQTSRVLVAEARSPKDHSGIVQKVVRAGSVESAGLLVLTGLVALCVMWRHLGDPLPWVIVGLGGALILPLAAYKGLLEGQHRASASNLALTGNTVIGLPILFLVMRIEPSLPAASLATVVGLMAPVMVCRAIVGKRLDHSDTRVRWVDVHRALKTSASMTVWSFGNLMVYAFDPAIVASAMGVEAAGEYGLASRIMTLAMSVPLAFGGLLTAKVASWRANEEVPSFFAKLRRATLLFALVGVCLGIVSGILGPFIAGYLSDGKVAANASLYWSLALYAAITTASAPLMAAFAGPRAARIRATGAMAAGCCNVLLSLVGVRLLGISGPVVASILCNCVVILILFRTVRVNPQVLTGVHHRGLQMEEVGG